MNFKYKILLATLLIIFISFSAFAETSGEHIDDATIASKTKAALISHKNVSARHIDVEVSKSIVQLSGFVDSESEENIALDIAKNIQGTKKVLDAIVVFSSSRSMGEALDDTKISATLKTRLTKADGLGSAAAINTEVKQGQVLLAGFVENAKIKNTAGEIAKSISGVTEVHNFIAVKQ